MKKTIVALVLMVGVLAGCQTQETLSVTTDPADPYAGWNIYSDPQGEFTVRYPADWTQDDETNVVELWDSLDDGKNSIKMVLTKDNKDNKGNNPTKTVQETQTITLNGKEVKVTQGKSLNVPYQTYEYPFATFTLKLTALFNDDTAEFRELATKVQESLKTLK